MGRAACGWAAALLLLIAPLAAARAGAPAPVQVPGSLDSLLFGDPGSVHPDIDVDRSFAAPETEAVAVLRGADLLDAAAVGFGGEDVVDGLEALRIRIRLQYPAPEAVLEGERVITMVFPSQYREDEVWQSGHYAFAASSSGAFLIQDGRSWVPDPPVAEYIRRKLYREPLFLVRERHSPELTAVHVGSGEIGGIRVEEVRVGYRGAVTVLSVDPASGRVLRAAHRGRLGWIGDIERLYSDFRVVDGLVLPFRTETLFDGAPITRPDLEVTEVTANPDVDRTLFSIPD